MKPLIFTVLICIGNILSGQEASDDFSLMSFLHNTSYHDYNEMYDLEINGETETIRYYYLKGRVDLYEECLKHIFYDQQIK